MNIFRKYPKKITFSKALEVLTQCLHLAEEPPSICACIWILGEYAEKIENCIQKVQQYVDEFEL